MQDALGTYTRRLSETAQKEVQALIEKTVKTTRTRDPEATPAQRRLGKGVIVTKEQQTVPEIVDGVLRIDVSPSVRTIARGKMGTKTTPVGKHVQHVRSLVNDINRTATASVLSGVFASKEEALESMLGDSVWGEALFSQESEEDKEE
jgi:hypothetical protein